MMCPREVLNLITAHLRATCSSAPMILLYHCAGQRSNCNPLRCARRRSFSQLQADVIARDLKSLSRENATAFSQQLYNKIIANY